MKYQLKKFMFHVNCMLMGEKLHSCIFYKKKKKLNFRDNWVGVQHDKALAFLTTNFHEACYHFHRLFKSHLLNHLTII